MPMDDVRNIWALQLLVAKEGLEKAAQVCGIEMNVLEKLSEGPEVVSDESISQLALDATELHLYRTGAIKSNSVVKTGEFQLSEVLEILQEISAYQGVRLSLVATGPETAMGALFNACNAKKVGTAQLCHV